MPSVVHARASGAVKVTKRRRQRPEQLLQANLVRFLNIALTGETFFFAVPNGGWRSATEAAIFRGQGVKAGVSDLIIIHKGHAFGLELKSDKGELSFSQRLAHEALRQAGMRIGIARTLDEAIAFLKTNGIPLRLAA